MQYAYDKSEYKGRGERGERSLYRENDEKKYIWLENEEGHVECERRDQSISTLNEDNNVRK